MDNEVVTSFVDDPLFINDPWQTASRMNLGVSSLNAPVGEGAALEVNPANTRPAPVADRVGAPTHHFAPHNFSRGRYRLDLESQPGRANDMVPSMPVNSMLNVATQAYNNGENHSGESGGIIARSMEQIRTLSFFGPTTALPPPPPSGTIPRGSSLSFGCMHRQVCPQTPEQTALSH